MIPGAPSSRTRATRTGPSWSWAGSWWLSRARGDCAGGRRAKAPPRTRASWPRRSRSWTRCARTWRRRRPRRRRRAKTRTPREPSSRASRTHAGGAERAAVPPEGGEVPEAEELAGLRLAHGSLRASHEQLEDELELLRGVRDERDRLAGELEQLRSAGADEERAKADLGDVIRQLQDRASESDAAREHLMAELTAAREEISTLRASLDAREAELAEARADAAQRIDAER